jgi:hypothetical protein
VMREAIVRRTGRPLGLVCRLVTDARFDCLAMET